MIGSEHEISLTRSIICLAQGRKRETGKIFHPLKTIVEAGEPYQVTLFTWAGSGI